MQDRDSMKDRRVRLYLSNLARKEMNFISFQVGVLDI